MTIFNKLFGLIPTSILVLILLGTPAMSADLRENVDAALAARGLIPPGQIGRLTQTKRAQALNKMMRLEAEYLQQPGVFGSGRLRLDLVQNKAFGTRGWKIQKGAQEVARAGLKKMHMAEEVQMWIESRKPDQIKMAQAVLELPATGTIDPETFKQANAYIKAGYETDITKLDFVKYVAGPINTTMFYRAATEGRIYVPDLDKEEEWRILKGLGMSEVDIQTIREAPLEIDKNDPSLDSREDMMATEYLSNPALYSAVIKIRNRAATDNKLAGSEPRVKTGSYENGLAAFNRGEFKTALRYWSPASANGDAASQVMLGWLYGNGLGVSRNYVEAVEWYKKSANQGNPDAQFNLGFLYAGGFGVSKNYKQAVNWYIKAANQGNIQAQNNLGLMYGLGKGVTRNYIKSYAWFTIAIQNSENSQAQNTEKIIGARITIAKYMTLAQISKARRIAREWRPGG